MAKNVKSTIGVIAVGIVAVGVVALGYKVNADRQNEQNVEYVISLIDQEKKQLPEVQKLVDGLYASDKKVFLKKDLTKEQIDVVSKKLSDIKADNSRLDVKDKKLTQQIEAFNQSKSELGEQISIAQKKLATQNATTDLFSEPITDWEKFDENAYIKADVKDTTVNNAKEQMKNLSDDDWTKVMNQYLKSATDQVNQIKAIRKTIEDLLPNGVISEQATAEAQANLVSEIEKVKNPEVQAELSAQATEIANQLALAATPVVESTVEQTVENTVESTVESTEPVVEVTEDTTYYEEPTYVPETPTYQQPTTPSYVQPTTPSTTPSAETTPSTTPSSETPASSQGAAVDTQVSTESTTNQAS